MMEIKCIWEHNGGDSLLYTCDPVGAYTRGESLEAAIEKMPDEVRSYFRWIGEDEPADVTSVVVQEKQSALDIRDADSDVIFDAERLPLVLEEYEKLKRLALKSAEDFLSLYNAVPEKDRSCLPVRSTFYGEVPRTAQEMYLHTKNVNDYYFGEIGIDADNDGTILYCRRRGFETLESKPGFLDYDVILGSYGEEWSLRKVMRRFIWHDRIHAKAMYRMAVRAFGADAVPDVFRFGE